MRLLIVIFLISICSFASAQYADQGASTLKNKIWWFDWNGFTIADGALRTFTTDDGLVVTITFSKVSGSVLFPTFMDTWSGALLYYLYNFSNTSIEPAFYYSNPSQDWTSNFSLNIKATRNGVPTPFSFVAADAEASAAGEEFSTLNTSGSVWNTIDFFRNSQQTDDPLTGCGTNSVTIVDTYGNQVGIGQNPVLETDAPATGLLNVDVALKEQGPQGGGMGLAFGIFAPVDRGDLPPSYGFAYHKIIYTAENSCNYNPPYPTLTQSQALKMGSVAPDADPVQYTDDNAHELADEEGVTSLPVYNGDGTYSVNVVVNNTTGNNAFLTGWFDYNRDGTFNANESATVTIANNATKATLKWVGLPATLPIGTVTNYGFRFRLSSDKAATQSATGFAKDGEVEDYLDTIIPPVVTPAFTIPDTVCVNSPVAIKNTTVGASSYYWSFCTADINQPPTGTNLGNVSNVLNTPVFIDYASQNGNYYAFTTNFATGELVRLDFGTSMLNTPTATDLGSFGGILPYATTEGIQVVQNNGNWYALIVGGTTANGTSPKIVKIAFGASLTNPNPVATDWGNIGNLDLPHDLYVFQQGTNWYGFTINKNNNTVTRFDFGNSFENVPSATNLGTFAGFNMPTGIFASNDNGQWHVFVVNSYDGPNPDVTAGTITRIDFGTSLLNTSPTSVNLGNIGGAFHNPRDIYIIKYCGANVGFVVNHATNDIVRLDFPGDLSTTPTATSLGNIGDLSFPHSISKLFRVGADIYALIPNASSSTITRIKFSGCNSSSTPSSTAQNPSPVTYSTPGVYNINLSIDDGLATQNSLCQQVVVLAGPTIKASNDTTICLGDSVHLLASGAASYQWLPTATLSNPNIPNPLATPLDSTRYYVTGKNSFGCAARDSVTVLVTNCTQTVITPVFTIPDTVCVNSPVTIKNTTVGASSYYWSFCTADINQPPVGTNYPLSQSNRPVFIDYAYTNGNYYGFVTSNNPAGLLRLDFGNSLLNIPTITNLGTVNGLLSIGTEGIQVVYNQNKWYLIIVEGDDNGGLVTPNIVTVVLGTNIANNNPTGTNWGNVGSLGYPHDLYVFQDNGRWFGVTANTANNTITRFNFGASFDNAPTGVNLGNVANFNGPTGLNAIKDATGNWHVFVTNALSSTLSRLDFGSSLLNTPTGINLGNIGGTFNVCWGVKVINYCGNSLAYVINAENGISGGEIVKLDFNGSLTNTPTAVDFGDIGNLNFPHCLSKLFRVGSNVYSFIADVATNSYTALQFTGCTNASVPNSTVQNPPNVTYSTPGVYNINLTIDDGLATQNSLCQQVVVLAPPTIKVNGDTSICSGDSVHLLASGAASYQWLPTATLSNPNVPNPVATPLDSTRYYVTAENITGCATKDSVTIKVLQRPTVQTIPDTSICSGTVIQLTSTAVNGSTYSWLPSTGVSNPTVLSPSASPKTTTTYTIAAAAKNGCINKDSVTVTVTPVPTITTLSDTTIVLCKNSTIQLTTTVTNANTYSWSPATGLSDANTLSPDATPLVDTKYTITASNGKCLATDSVSITVKPSPSVTAAGDTVICSGSTVHLSSNASPNVTYSWLPVTGLSDPSSPNPSATSLSSTVYVVQVAYSNGCTARDSVNIKVNPQPSVSTLPDTAICAGTTIQLITTVINANAYSWSPTAGLSNASTISPLASPTNTTQYIVTVNPGGLCTAKDSVTVTVNPSPAVTVSADATICSGTSTQLTAKSAGNVTFNWSPNAGLSDSSIYNPVASPTATTQYLITVTLNGQCSTKDSVTVNVVPQPSVKSIPDTAICNGTTIQLTTTAVNGNTYSWLPVTALSSPSALSPSANPQASIQYIITVNPGSQCIAMDTVNVTVNPLPLVTVSADTLICTGGAGQLVASSPNNVTYSWLPITGLSSPSIPNPLATPASTTDYNVTVTDGNFCTASATVVVIVNPQPVFGITPSTASICIGNNVTVTASGGDIYSWSPTDGVTDPTAPSTVLSPQATTNYQVFITNSTCKVTDTVQALITVTTKPVVTISKSNDLDCFVGQATLQATGGDQYTWSPAASLNNPYSASPVASPFTTTTYYVEVSKGAGCVAEDSIQLKVLTNEQNGYNVPTAFTPNGDGYNDCFGVKLWGGIKSIDFAVYNRWGERIFHTNNPSDCWDGTYNGQKQQPGAFVYQIQANTICGAVYRKGTVVLIR